MLGVCELLQYDAEFTLGLGWWSFLHAAVLGRAVIVDLLF